MQRPNVVLLFTDQQRFDTIKACGFEYMKTPNLDRLVKEGCRFDHAYSPNPVCIPARHNLITGLSARYHGYSDNKYVPMKQMLPTLMQLLSNNGYDTRAIGKMHFVPHSRNHNGFNKMELMEEIPQYREDDEYAMYLKENGYGDIANIHGVRNLLYMLPQQSLIPEEHHGSTWVGNRSVEYINKNAGHRPFFLWASWIAPHPPFDVPDSFADLYKNEKLPLPLESKTELKRPAAKSMAYVGCKLKDTQLRRMRELYYAAISLVDKNMGKVIDALEQANQLDNTLIIMCSDHGEMLGDHGCYQKMLPYDSSSRIPFIIRYPKHFNAGDVNHDFCDLNDIMPTVLDAAGIEMPRNFDYPGESLLRPGKKDRQWQYVEYAEGWRRWISMRNKRWKYNYYYTGAEELFDMINDPSESENLLESKAADHENIRLEMRAKLAGYEQRYGLEGYCDGKDFLSFESKDVNCAHVNPQFPVFPLNDPHGGKTALQHRMLAEIKNAIKNEPSIAIGDLPIDKLVAFDSSMQYLKALQQN